MRYLRLSILAILSLISTGIIAQSDKAELNNFEKNFKTFKKSHTKGYNDFVEQIDLDFANFLRKNWKEIHIQKGVVLLEKPKPKLFPIAEEKVIVSEELELIIQDGIELEEALVMPVNYKMRSFGGSPLYAELDFYGDTIQVKYIPKFDSDINQTVNPESIAQFWESISKLDYRLVLDDLLFYKKKYALNDYGFYLLIKKFSDSIATNKNHAVLMTWYLMNKSKYKTKIGYNSESIFLLLPSKTQVYGMSYFKNGEITYYVMDYAGGSLLTYKDNYELAYRSVSFAITKTLQLPENLERKTVKFTFQDKNYSFDLAYNLNAIKFYDDFPQIEIKTYFNSTITASASKAIIENLKPIVSTMDELTAVNFLLVMVQQGFTYQIDDTQFGKEKAFFAEEMLHYPYSDCEDRAVFFAYLVNTLLGNEVVGLDYPEHVATAVHFEKDYPGDFYMFNGKKFIVCDPTYINAPVGVSMKDLSATKAALVLRNNDGILSDGLLEKLKRMFGIEGNIDLPKVIEVESGKIVVANYTNKIMIQDQEIETESESVFTAKFDDKNQLVWMNNTSGSNKFIDVVTQNESTFLLYHKRLNKSSSNVLSKTDKSGNVVWSNDIAGITSVYQNANTQVTLFDMNGNKVAGKTYTETEFFETERMRIRKNKVLVILPMGRD